MEVGATVDKSTMPKSFSKGSSEYAPLRQAIGNLVSANEGKENGDLQGLPITCTNTDELRKAKASAKRYIEKQGYKLSVKTDNLTLWIVP